MTMQATDWEEIFINPFSDRGLDLRACKEFFYSDNKKIKRQQQQQQKPTLQKKKRFQATFPKDDI